MATRINETGYGFKNRFQKDSKHLHLIYTILLLFTITVAVHITKAQDLGLWQGEIKVPKLTWNIVQDCQLSWRTADCPKPIQIIQYIPVCSSSYFISICLIIVFHHLTIKPHSCPSTPPAMRSCAGDSLIWDSIGLGVWRYVLTTQNQLCFS